MMTKPLRVSAACRRLSAAAAVTALTTLALLGLSGPAHAQRTELILPDVPIGNATAIDIGLVEFFAGENTDDGKFELVLALPGFTETSQTYAGLAEAYRRSGRIVLANGKELGAAERFVAIDNPGELHGETVAPRKTRLLRGKNKFEQLTLSNIDRNQDGDSTDLLDDAGNYVTSFIAVLDELTADKRDDSGNYDFSKHEPVALIGHSMGGLIILEAIDENPQLDFTSRFGVTQIVLISPATAREVTQWLIDSGFGVAAALPELADDPDPTIGKLVTQEDNPGNFLKVFCSDTAGNSDDIPLPDDAYDECDDDFDCILRLRDDILRDYIRPESVNVSAQVASPVFDNGVFDNANLASFVQFGLEAAPGLYPAAAGGRPSIARGLLRESGIEVNFIVGAEDTVASPDEVRNLALYVSGTDSNVRVLEDQTHCAYFVAPEAFTQ
jgi:pimeloyl-ACP methyl ester carboxylesterase